MFVGHLGELALSGASMATSFASVSGLSLLVSPFFPSFYQHRSSSSGNRTCRDGHIGSDHTHAHRPLGTDAVFDRHLRDDRHDGVRDVSRTGKEYKSIGDQRTQDGDLPGVTAEDVARNLN